MPAAAPAAAEDPTAPPAHLNHPEGAPEPEAPTAEGKRDSTGAPERGTESRQAKTMPSPAVQAGERAAQMAASPETVPAEAVRGEAAVPAAVPAEPEAQTAAPAELIYRAEAAASQTAQGEAAPAQRAKDAEAQTAQTAAPLRRETRTRQIAPESLRVEAPAPGANPEQREKVTGPSAAERGVRADRPAETHHHAASPTEWAEAKQPEAAPAEAALPAALPAGWEAQTSQSEPLIHREEGEAPQTALPAALPAEAGEQTSVPAALVYREEEKHAPAQSPREQEPVRQQPGSERAPSTHEASPKGASETIRRPAKAGTESPRTDTSVPLTRREREAKASASGSPNTAASPVRPAAEMPRSAAILQTGSAGQTAFVREMTREEDVPSEAPLPAGEPAETEAAFPESMALVYRKEGEEPALPAERPAEKSPILRDSERQALPIPEHQTNKKISAAPATAIPLRTWNGEGKPPVALAFRRESGGEAPAAVGSVARDIRLTADRGRNPFSGAVRTSRQAANPARAGTNTTTLSTVPIPTAPEEKAIPAPAPLPETEMLPEPSELVYASAAGTGDYAAAESPTRPTRKAQEDKNESLPAWAKELLEQAGVTDTAQMAAAFRDTPNGASGSRQISWNAPAAAALSHNREISNPAELSFKERSQKEEPPSRPQITEAELQKTADRVYRILEERLRRELRRSGR